MMRNKKRQICLFLCGVLLVVGFGLSVTVAHQCSHGHRHHRHHHVNDEDVGAAKNDRRQHRQRLLLPEEIVEDEDLKMMLAAHDEHDHDDGHENGHKHDGHLMPSGLGFWIHAMGCSLLVSLASLICLILLPLIFIQGKPSKAVVDSLALFGHNFTVGMALGSAFFLNGSVPELCFYSIMSYLKRRLYLHCPCRRAG